MMTRVTRAASRRNNIHDIENPTETTPHASPIEASNNASVFCSTRNTLGEITGNRDYVQTSSISPEPKRAADGVSPEKTTENATGPQIKRSRSIRDLINPEDLGIKVFGKARLTGAGGDDLQTPHTQASDPVLDSRREQKGGGTLLDAQADYIHSTDIPSDTMGQLLENQVSPRSQPLRLAPPRFGQTPRFDPAIHQSPVEEDLMNEDEDSFLQTIISRSPSKLNGSDKWPNTPTESMASMSLQSPARSYKDIEDPLDAIDALEDALEQIGQALPVIEDRGLDSPVRAGTPTNGAPQSRPHGAPEAHLSRVQSNGTEPATRKRTVSFHRLRDGIEQKPQPREANPSNTPSNPAITRQSSLTTARTANGPVRSVSKTARPASNDASSTSIQPSMVRKGSHPNLSSNTASTTVSKASKPRPQSTVISTSKPGFTPSKSTKPPTRPTFELPGEAISRQRRAQREERLKREEEELQRKREFKARKPRHLSSTPSLPVKDTATSRSRATLKADEPGSPGNPSILQNGRSSSLMPGRTSSFRTPSTSSRTSNPTQPNNASTVKKSTSVSPATPAKPTTLNGTSRRLSSNESRTPKSCSRAESTPASSRTPATTNTARTDDNTLPVQRSRGKEIFTRERIHERERERERREKEEAAKRARVEAAERGRLASREWAERQKARMAARKSRSHPDLKAEEGS